jgi:hypothetical protein
MLVLVFIVTCFTGVPRGIFDLDIFVPMRFRQQANGVSKQLKGILLGGRTFSALYEGVCGVVHVISVLRYVQSFSLSYCSEKAMVRVVVDDSGGP